jgi:hypothetical protein
LENQAKLTITKDLDCLYDYMKNMADEEKSRLQSWIMDYQMVGL